MTALLERDAALALLLDEVEQSGWTMQALRTALTRAGANPLDRVYSLGFAATTTIRRSDFGVSAYVPAIGDNVTLTIDVEFKAVP
eukprot:gene63694-87113_t